MNWRVKWEDIMLGTIEGERKMKKQAASNLSLARVRLHLTKKNRFSVIRKMLGILFIRLYNTMFLCF